MNNYSYRVIGTHNDGTRFSGEWHSTSEAAEAQLRTMQANPQYEGYSLTIEAGVVPPAPCATCD